MKTGVVKFFDPNKGFGFIVPDDATNDVFFHVSELQKAGVQDIEEGAALGFDVKEKNNGKTQAINIDLL